MRRTLVALGSIFLGFVENAGAGCSGCVSLLGWSFLIGLAVIVAVVLGYLVFGQNASPSDWLQYLPRFLR